MSYEEAFSLVVDLCTIAAFIIAFIAWKNWKKQQAYTLILDHIFAFEVALNSYFSLELALIEIELEHIKQYQAQNRFIRWPFVFYLDRFKNRIRYKTIENKIHSYNDALSTLQILDIKYDQTQIQNAAHYEHHISCLYQELDQSRSIDAMYAKCDEIQQYITQNMQIALAEVKVIRKTI